MRTGHCVRRSTARKSLRVVATLLVAGVALTLGPIALAAGAATGPVTDSFEAPTTTPVLTDTAQSPTFTSLKPAGGWSTCTDINVTYTADPALGAENIAAAVTLLERAVTWLQSSTGLPITPLTHAQRDNTSTVSPTRTLNTIEIRLVVDSSPLLHAGELGATEIWWSGDTATNITAAQVTLSAAAFSGSNAKALLVTGHELVHAVGGGHSPDPTSFMYHQYSNTHDVTAGDYDKLNELSAAGCTQT
jgi:hypothetical protein